ncbi:translation termination factor Rrf1 [Schizosaccharomyces japonicus yFS275]|uniref:Translation termination factor Rrf1 n=1 Tax=Schizosaccharomyces japonicus (strain yFS275 / FY16936) TaxID=402676 RepID=B6K3P2_SCHJY|nr:translation termination factor Rrf1 [Schizosaccharomyces japonicus yFS275]EEB08099.2 translation termination factor Rrf1 [Schizosaccharomyces japonicus yFS275]
MFQPVSCCKLVMLKLLNPGKNAENGFRYFSRTAISYKSKSKQSKIRDINRDVNVNVSTPEDFIYDLKQKLQGIPEKLTSTLKVMATDSQQGNVNQLEHVMVSKPKQEEHLLKDIAAISRVSGKVLNIKPYSPQDVKYIMKAITSSNLRMQPVLKDSVTIQVRLQETTLETLKALAKQIKEQEDRTKVAIRLVRTSFQKKLARRKLSKVWSEDECRKVEKDMQDTIQAQNGQLTTIIERYLKQLKEQSRNKPF